MIPCYLIQKGRRISYGVLDVLHQLLVLWNTLIYNHQHILVPIILNGHSSVSRSMSDQNDQNTDQTERHFVEPSTITSFLDMNTF